MSIFNGFFVGFWAPLKAIRPVFSQPRLTSLVAVPLFINLGLYILFFYYGSNALSGLIQEWTQGLSHSLPAWAVEFSRISLKILAWLTLGLIGALSFTVVSGVISAPFNDALSRATFKMRYQQLGLKPDRAFTEISIKQSITLELKRMAILIVGSVTAILIGLIPFLQLPALALGAFLLAFEYFGYPLSHRSSSLVSVFLFVFRYPLVSLGFGSFLLVIMALPFTSVLYIPLAVVGGTTLFVDLETKKKLLLGEQS
ncbi:MAG: EI24 domain-containing protein [Bdellovibrionota bacterium]